MPFLREASELTLKINVVEARGVHCILCLRGYMFGIPLYTNVFRFQIYV